LSYENFIDIRTVQFSFLARRKTARLSLLKDPGSKGTLWSGHPSNW